MNSLPNKEDLDSKGRPRQAYAETYRVKGERHLTIALNKRKCRTWDDAIDTVIHEYVHCILWGPAALEHNCQLDDHDPAFGAKYHQIHHHFHYEGGDAESKKESFDGR